MINLRHLVLGCLWLSCVVAGAGADQVVTGGADYVGARVVGLREGKLRFHTADGVPRWAWVNEVTLILVDRGGIFADFNQAERFLAGGEPQRAMARYRRVGRLAEAFWADLIQMRMSMACDAMGQLDKAIASFIVVLQSERAGPPAAARLFPREIPPTPSAKVARAVQSIEAALAQETDEARRALFEVVRFKIFDRCNHQRTGWSAQRVADLSIPLAACSDEVYETILAALRLVLSESASPAAMAGLDRAIGHAPRSLVPDFLLLKGTVLLARASTREESARASWPFLRIAIHFPDDARAAEGLLGAAKAVEQFGRKDKAVELLEECIAHARIDEATRQAAEVARTRLMSGRTG